MKFSYLSGSLGVPTKYSLEPYKSKTKFIVAALLCCLVILCYCVSQVLSSNHPVVRASSENLLVSPSVASGSSKLNKNPIVPEPISQFDDKKLSGVLNSWISSHGGDYSVAISDQTGKELAQYGSNDQYYMASIYKLYVAYVAYQKVDSGAYDLDEAYLGGMSRGMCLDEMIRTSHSACGEKMLEELGPELRTKLNSYGLSSTSISGFTTSAADANKILTRIKSGSNLSESSRMKLLSSMLGQKYREGLPAGFEGAKVYDKVGFRAKEEYHDVGIVELPDGRTLIVSVLSNKLGADNIADLSRTLSASL